MNNATDIRIPYAVSLHYNSEVVLYTLRSTELFIVLEASPIVIIMLFALLFLTYLSFQTDKAFFVCFILAFLLLFFWFNVTQFLIEGQITIVTFSFKVPFYCPVSDKTNILIFSWICFQFEMHRSNLFYYWQCIIFYAIIFKTYFKINF